MENTTKEEKKPQTLIKTQMHICFMQKTDRCQEVGD